jgi:hypothetical protein
MRILSAVCALMMIGYSVPAAEETKAPKEPAPVKVRIILEDKTIGYTIDGEKVALKEFARHLEPLVKNDERGPNGEIQRRVSLVVPNNLPMRDLESVVMTLAAVKLVNVQYLLEDPPKGEKKPAPETVDNDKSPKQTVRVHVMAGENAGKIQVVDKVLTLEEADKDPSVPFPKEHVTVKVSYAPNARWADVVKVFDICAKRGVSECGLVPLRADATDEK